MKFEYAVLKELKGQGLFAEDASGNTFKLGRPEYVAPGQEKFAGKDVLLSYCNMVVAGFDIQDELKPGIKETIGALNRMGIRTVMLSGDNEKKNAPMRLSAVALRNSITRKPPNRNWNR